MRDTFILIAALVSAVGGVSGIVAILQIQPQKRKLVEEAKQAGADASQAVAEGATLLLLPLQGRIKELETQIRTLEAILNAERRASQEVIRDLHSQLASRDAHIATLRRGGESFNGTGPHA